MKICPRCSELQPDDATRCPKDGAELRTVLDPLIGKTVAGRYRLISRLGSGGMSSVYLARHVMIDRLVAVKTLRRDLAQDPVQRDRFIREARAVNRINHENIVDISDFGETEDGLVYLVMEYVPGESLLKAMSRAPFVPARALFIAEQVGGALGRAHQMGVVHRDLKPENILLVPRRGQPDFVKILDFGIAKILDAPSLTGSQQIFGTPGYIAPEYIQSTHIDGRADLYSTGVILYEMVTGALPFDYEYPGDLLVKHVTEQPIPPRERLASVEGPMEDLILRCLRKDPAQRFRDAFHFLEELRSTRERLGSASRWGAMGQQSSADSGGFASPTPLASPDQGLLRSLREASEAPATPAAAVGVAVGGGTPSPMQGLDASTAFRPGDTVQEVRPPRMTMSYERRAIPEPPSVDGVPLGGQVETPAGPVPGPESEPPPALGTGDQDTGGVFGVRRWRRRFEVLRAVLDDIEAQAAAPADVAQAMAFASAAIDDLEEGAARVEPRQDRIEALQREAQDFRTTLGRAIDELAQRLSGVRGAFEQVAHRRNGLRARREASLVRVRSGEPVEGEADALLWELAAVEQELRERALHCDEIECKLADVRGELEKKNEEVEAELSRLIGESDEAVVGLDRLAASLRGPLDLVEAFVRGWWTSHPDHPAG